MQLLENDLQKILGLPNYTINWNKSIGGTLYMSSPNGKSFGIDLHEYKIEIENYFSEEIKDDDFQYDVADYDNCIYIYNYNYK